MSSDSDEEEEDQAKHKDINQKQPHTNPSFSTMVTKTLKQSKPFITKYFDSMTSETHIMYTTKEKHICDTIMAQLELNSMECEALDQDSLEDID